LRQQRRTQPPGGQAVAECIKDLKSLAAGHRAAALGILVLAVCLLPFTIAFIVIVAPFVVVETWLRQTETREVQLDREIAQVEEKLRSMQYEM
jgi:hypothetical protein